MRTLLRLLFAPFATVVFTAIYFTAVPMLYLMANQVLDESGLEKNKTQPPENKAEMWQFFIIPYLILGGIIGWFWTGKHAPPPLPESLVGDRTGIYGPPTEEDIKRDEAWTREVGSEVFTHIQVFESEEQSLDSSQQESKQESDSEE